MRCYLETNYSPLAFSISDLLCWDAAHNAIRFDILGNNSSSSDYRPPPNGNSWKNDHAPSYPDVITDNYGAIIFITLVNHRNITTVVLVVAG